MSMEDSPAWEIDWEKHCIVCGKSVLDGEGYCHMRVEDEMVAICCPLCFENFEKDPKRYLSLRRLRQSDPRRIWRESIAYQRKFQIPALSSARGE